MSQYILTIDQGTTSSRAILYTPDMKVVASGQEEFKQHYPDNGWVEHDPEDIWQTVLRSCKKAMVKAGASASDVQGIGITNQRETTVVWDKHSGEPVCRAIVWQDRRTSDICRELQEQGLLSKFHNSTGLRLDPYFSGTKLKWILDNVKGARERAEKGDLLFGTVDTFLLWRFSKGQVHATDATNASRTLMFNIHKQEWDQELLEILGVPASMLPEVKDNAAEFGQCDAEWLGRDIPICSMIGDQHSALVGQACFKPGMIKSTYGTGCFAVVNTGDEIRVSENNLLTTVGYRLQGKTTYALEGSIFMAGAIIQWLRDSLGLLEKSSDAEKLAESVPHDQSEIMVPAFTGLGAPYWDPDARAAIFGMTRDTGAKQLVAAAIHSVALQTEDLLRAMVKDGIEVKTLRVDGGMVKNRWFLQALASITAVETVTSNTAEATAQGATMLAALQLGHYDSLEAMEKLWEAKEQYQPKLEESKREDLYQRWQSAVAKVRSE
ncbi:glycerol kinase GlpK [Marinimicrobium sp. ABcell2]|uniref:glycerol kinase GlpK n=1 Tax=Marinimicrobium sp. ABcell2 TaxID=3069751 RepID=UPI0027B4A9C2|nr:glycerol kinase GlpK [Marinimicrobium sp. ABcell2]MDQ2077776.1 glycerol kinase GlpK [Marinimicrobium sp. ABcell2]